MKFGKQKNCRKMYFIYFICFGGMKLPGLGTFIANFTIFIIFFFQKIPVTLLVDTHTNYVLKIFTFGTFETNIKF